MPAADTSSNAHYPPALCRSCRRIVPAYGFSLENSRSISFQGISGGPCQYCGGTWDVLDGVYDAVGPVLSILSGPDSTYEALMAAAAIVERSKAAGESEAKTVERVAEVLPSIKKLRGPLKGFLVAAAFWAITYAANKVADLAVDPLLKKPDITSAQYQQVLRDAAEHGARAYEEAARKASVAPSPGSATPPPHPKTGQLPPRFPKSMEKLASESKKRYRYQGSQWRPEGGNRGGDK